MYTLQEYIIYIKEQCTLMDKFLEKFNPNIVNGIISAISVGHTAELADAAQTFEQLSELREIKKEMALAKLLKDTDNKYDIFAYSQLAKVIILLSYCRRRYNTCPTEKDIIPTLKEILVSFSELNPHKSSLEEIFNAIEMREYEEYFTVLNINSAAFLSYPNSVIKVNYNKHMLLATENLKNELLINWILDGESKCGLQPIKAFYISPKLDSDNLYHSIIIYDLGTLYEPDVDYTANSSSSRFNQVISNNTEALKCYPENKDLQLFIDIDSMSIEPIYINNENMEEGDYLNINYPHISLTNNVLKGRL